MQLKEGMTVIAPKGCEAYLTEGKGYVVIKIHPNGTFRIVDDSKDTILCAIESCSHLNFGDWIIKPEADPRIQQQIQLAKSNIEVLELMANYIKNSSEPSRIEDFDRVIDQKLANEKEKLNLELMLGIKNINP